MQPQTRVLFILYLMTLACPVLARDSTGVDIFVSKQRINEKEIQLDIKVIIPMGIKFYGLKRADSDALFSSLVFDTAANSVLAGSPVEAGVRVSEKDASLGTLVHFFRDSVIWRQKLSAGPYDSFLVKGTVNYLYRKGDEYLPGEKPFRIFIQPEAGSIQATKSADSRSLWWIFLTAFAGGLLALLTPCVYSMIPITVSFFVKRSDSRKAGIKNALLYSASIIVVFTGMGFLITLLFGPQALNSLATNWIANLFFFVLFVLFGLSFLGAFEMTLPSSWSTRADSRAGMNNVTGIFFMALTLVLVSFSCTGPIIGNLLVLAAKGNYFGPLTGMFGFSLALALPFALFAFFPGKLNKLGRAGGWLNAVKVTLGFLELALALKFLSNADLAMGWRLLDREVFICLWVIIFSMLGVYLLGKIRFHHDDALPKNDFGLPHLSVTRLLLSIAALSLALYMIPGLWGAPLKAISAFVPPMGTQDFNTQVAAGLPGIAEHEPVSPVKYVDRMKIYEPEVVTKYGMITYFDYDEALKAARALHKPLMLDFTGINCVNCRKMEGQVWSDPAVMRLLKEDFVIVSLYVDANNVDLQENEQYFSKALNKQVQTLGDKNTDMQVTRFGANSQPYYFFVDGKEQRLVPDGYGYDPSVEKFITHLHKVLDADKK